MMYRIRDGVLQVLLAHPGGPLFQNRDDGAWSIPKGEIEPGEDLLAAAQREFAAQWALLEELETLAFSRGQNDAQ